MRIAADANFLLSAVIGGRAKTVFSHPAIEEILTTATILDEVREYAVELAQKRGLSPHVVLLAVSALPVTVIEGSAYSPALDEARRRIGRRDPDDVELLACALYFNLPVWSNDNDFADAGVPWFTTARLLSALEGKRVP